MIPPPYGPPKRPISARIARVFWASFPVWSVGLLAWVPSLRLAWVERSRLAWEWFAAFVAATVGAWWYVFATATHQADGKFVSSDGGALCVILLMVVPTIHYCLMTRVNRPPYGAPNSYGYFVYASQPQQPTLPMPLPPPPNPTPAEIQAGLRELRDILGRGEQP